VTRGSASNTQCRTLFVPTRCTLDHLNDNLHIKQVGDEDVRVGAATKTGHVGELSHDMWSLQLTFLSMRSMGNRKSPLIAKVVTSVILDLNVQ